MKTLLLIVFSICISIFKSFGQGCFPKQYCPSANDACCVAYQGDSLLFHPQMDQRYGMPQCFVPLPADWKVYTDSISGPYQTIAKQYSGKGVMESQRVIADADQLLREDFIPLILKDGGTVVDAFDLPEVALRFRAFLTELYPYYFQQTTLEVRALEVKDQECRQALLILYFYKVTSEFGNYSFYAFSTLESEPDYYPKAKAHYLHALRHTQLNPDYVRLIQQPRRWDTWRPMKRYDPNVNWEDHKNEYYIDEIYEPVDTVNYDSIGWKTY